MRTNITRRLFRSWRQAGLFLLSWTALVCVPARSQDALSADSLLSVIHDLYDSGSFVSAELESRRLLDRPDLNDSSRILAEQYIAFSLIAQGKNGAAGDYFVSILEKDSTYGLDPLMISPKIISVFEDSHRRYEQKKSAATPSVVAPAELPAPGPSFRLLLFPGWDQIHQGRSTKGTVLLAAGAASAGAVVTFDLLRRSARDDYLAAKTLDEATDKYEDYDRYYKAEYYSVAAFVAVYLYSAFDAFFDLPPDLDGKTLPDGSGMQLSLRIPF
jgi:hypothetical protein